MPWTFCGPGKASARFSNWCKDCANKQRRGLHFALASVPAWYAVLAVRMTGLAALTKNLPAFCCTARPPLPAYSTGKIVRADFRDRAKA